MTTSFPVTCTDECTSTVEPQGVTVVRSLVQSQTKTLCIVRLVETEIDALASPDEGVSLGDTSSSEASARAGEGDSLYPPTLGASNIGAAAIRPRDEHDLTLHDGGPPGAESRSGRSRPMEDEREPKSLQKFGYRDYLTFSTKLEETDYFLKYQKKLD